MKANIWRWRKLHD